MTENRYRISFFTTFLRPGALLKFQYANHKSCKDDTAVRRCKLLGDGGRGKGGGRGWGTEPGIELSRGGLP